MASLVTTTTTLIDYVIYFASFSVMLPPGMFGVQITKLYIGFAITFVALLLASTIRTANAIFYVNNSTFGLQFVGGTGGGNTNTATHSELRTLQLKLIEQHSIRKFKGHLNHLSSSKNEIPSSVTLFADDAFKDIIGEANQTIFVFPMVVSERGMGNSLGRFLQAIGVAVETGLHFIALPFSMEEFLDEKAIGRRQLKKHEASQISHPTTAFFDALHLIYQHPHPTKEPREEIVKKLKFFAMFEFPWEHANRPWFTVMDLIPRILDNAIDSYLKQTEQHKLLIPSHQVDHQRNFDSITVSQPSRQRKNLQSPSSSTNIHHKQMAPLIPDAAIVFRCNEVLPMKPEKDNRNLYGFQNFNVYSRLIPKETTKSIYILTEPRDYNNYILSVQENTTWSDACASILDNMTDYLHENFKQAAIGVIRGHQIDSFVRLARAPVVISTASTYSFWPMLANRNHPYYQLSLLVLGDKPHHLTDNFTFITAPRHMNFGDINIGAEGQPAVDRILAALRAIPAPTNDTVSPSKSILTSTLTSTMASFGVKHILPEWLRLENNIEN